MLSEGDRDTGTDSQAETRSANWKDSEIKTGGDSTQKWGRGDAGMGRDPREDQQWGIGTEMGRDQNVCNYVPVTPQTDSMAQEQRHPFEFVKDVETRDTETDTSSPPHLSLRGTHVQVSETQKGLDGDWGRCVTGGAPGVWPTQGLRGRAGPAGKTAMLWPGQC